MKSILLISIFLSFWQLHAQSKKEQIAILKKSFDSLVQINNSNIKINNILNFSFDSLKLIVDKQKNAINDFEIKNNKLKDSIINLKSVISWSNNETALYQNEIYELNEKVKLLQGSTSNFIFPFEYGDPIYNPIGEKLFATAYLDFKAEKQVITDSLVVKFNEKDIFHFYYFTPIKENLNLQCPEEFGYCVFDNSGKEIFRNFNSNEIGGNSYAEYLEFDLVSKKRRLMGLLSSGCGSGGSIQFYDLEIVNGKLIQSQSISISTGGYQTTCFLPERKIYVQLTRINPKSHWGEENTRYTLDFYSLINDQKIATRSTKFSYPHFGNLDYLDYDALWKMIEKREPNIFKL
jgi:hypothetical protein